MYESSAETKKKVRNNEVSVSAGFDCIGITANLGNVYFQSVTYVDKARFLLERFLYNDCCKTKVVTSGQSQQK